MKDRLLTSMRTGCKAVAAASAMFAVLTNTSARAAQIAPSAPPVLATASDPATTESRAAAERARRLEGEAYQTNNIVDFRIAADALELAVRLDLDNLGLRKSLAFIALEKLGDPRRAYGHAEYVVKHTPADVGWTQMLAKAAVAMGRKDRAVTIYMDLIQKNQAGVWDRLALAKLLIEKGRDEQVERLYLDTLKVEPNNEFAHIAYAEWRMSRGHRGSAEQMARQVLERNPTSAGAHSLLGDLYRTDWDLARAQVHYDAALATDPRYYTAVAGLKEIRKSRAPRINSSPNRFRDTNGLDQAGLFNSVSVAVTDRLFLSPQFNRRWFRNEKLGVDIIERVGGGLDLDYRFGNAWSVGAGAFAFQTERQGPEGGFNGYITWVPLPAFYAYLHYRTHDPVNESIVTIQRNFTQDIVGSTAGLQITSRWSLTVTGSVAEYSDNNRRRYLNAETAYRMFNQPLTHLRLQYEVFDYRRRAPEYPSPQWYEYVRPVLEVTPRITQWLSFQTKLELPNALDEAEWGTGITIGPILKLFDDRLNVSASYLRYDLPGEFTNYSGQGFKAGLAYRF